MANNVLGGGYLSGSLGESPDFSGISAPLNRILTSVLPTGYLQNWIVQETSGDGAQSLANGYYANRIPLSDLDLNTLRESIETNSDNISENNDAISGLGDDVQVNATDIANLIQVLALKGETLPIASGVTLSSIQDNEISSTQSNPLPAANSVPVNKILQIVVPKQYAGIETTHVCSGSDTITSNGTDTSIILKWLSGGVATFASNGADNWRRI